jgi:haloalkane dehalogenase
VDGSIVAVTDVGEGPILLLVHTGLWSFVWRDVIMRLAPEFRCVCLDAPGTGQSDRISRDAVTLESASRAVAAVVEALDLQSFALVIHDLGGPAGLAAIARTPERVCGIVAVNAFGWRPSGKLFRGMLALMGSGLMREFDAFTQLIPRITATAFGAARRMDAASRRAFRAGIGREGIRSFHYYLRDALHCDSLYDKVERAMTGPLRDLPLLTIFGEYNDPLGFQPTWKGLFPEAPQVIVPKGNHFPMCDDPELVSRTIRSWHREKLGAAE